ncbi:MAG TPA: ATP-binding protein [Vicinamibacteria bacterium]|nr:ATP-binding protein [Vicinamibacteria bacterium]
MSRPRGASSWIVPVALLFMAQLGVLTLLGPRNPGPALAEVVEIAIYSYSVHVFLRAARASRSLARSFWSVAAFSSVLFCVGTLCTLYAELIEPSRSIVDLADAISVFWFGPVSLTLFLEPDFTPRRFDRIHLLDFVQVVLLWIVIYLFFHYLPTHETAGSPFAHSWLRATWTGTLLYDGVMAGTFLLRAAVSDSRIVRALFGRVGLFLVLACAGDFYFNYLGAALPNGSWYEVVWTLLAIVPIVIAATWNEAAIEASADGPQASDVARNRLFPTLFAFLVLVLSLGILREEPTLALIIVAVSFGCSSTRLILVQERQDRIQTDLRTQIAERERIERQLRDNEEHLEEQVAERTARLEESRTQLRQAQKMEAIGRLAGGVAHDFNNLLTVIRGYGQLIVRRAPTPELRANAERIDEAAERAASLTRQLLAFSRRQVLQPTVFNLNALVRNLDRMLRRLIGEDVEMTTVLAPDLGSVRADQGQIEQVIMNLVVNARDAMPGGGKLTLETANVLLDDAYLLQHPTSRRGRHVLLAVSDTGVGIDPRNLAQVFEPFYTTKEPGRGTGLGLSMVYGIVKQSGGNIWVYSEPGRGTSFKVYLPVVDAPDELLPAEPPRGVRNDGSETVLLVEDDQQVRELARTVLADCGYVVLAAENAALADSLCRTHPGQIHLLLTDVVMPGLGGRELARQVTALRPQVRVLYMSGYTTNAIVHHGELDADASFLPKPFTPASLAAKVREVLDRGHP